MRELEKRRAEKLQSEMEGKAVPTMADDKVDKADTVAEENLVFKKASISNAEPNEKTLIRKKRKNKKKK